MTSSRKCLVAIATFGALTLAGCSGPDPGGYGTTLKDAEDPAPADDTLRSEDPESKGAGVRSWLGGKCPSTDVIEYAEKGDLDSFRQCLKAGNDPWIVAAPKSKRPRRWELPGNSALYYAARNGHLDVVKLLIEEYRVSPDWGGAMNTVPVVAAIQGGHFETARFLLDAGADTRRWDAGGETALIAAIQKRDTKYLDAVLFAGAFPNEMNGFVPVTPLSIAMNNRKYEHARMLVESGACVGSHLKTVERELERSKRRDPSYELQDLANSFRNFYDPNCRISSASGDEYQWQRARDADEIEIANRAG